MKRKVKIPVCKRCGGMLMREREGFPDWTQDKFGRVFDLKIEGVRVYRCRGCHSDDRIIIHDRKEAGEKKSVIGRR